MKKTAFFAFIFIISTSIFAHEYILWAYNYIVKKGETLEIHLFVSDGFNIQAERPFQKDMTKSFGLITENGNKNLLVGEKPNELPILTYEVDFEGQGLFYMERNYASITLPNDEFKEYLLVDNIENISINDSKKSEQKEVYTRYIKALVQSNLKENDEIFKKRVGHVFEIILFDNPYEAQKNTWIKAQVFWEGKPMANKVITARNRVGSEIPNVQYARTDNDGICTFKLDREGDWFLHATHMRAAKDNIDADWESFWTTFSFGFHTKE